MKQFHEHIASRSDFVSASQLILNDFKSGKPLTLTPELINAKSIDDELKDQLKSKLEHFKTKIPLRNEINNLIDLVENFKKNRKGTNDEITAIADNLTKKLDELKQALHSEKTALTDLQKKLEDAVEFAQKENNALIKNYTKENGQPTFFTRRTTAEDITALKILLSKTLSEAEAPCSPSNGIQ